jgi:hypothetical protein
MANLDVADRPLAGLHAVQKILVMIGAHRQVDVGGRDRLACNRLGLARDPLAIDEQLAL